MSLFRLLRNIKYRSGTGLEKYFNLKSQHYLRLHTRVPTRGNNGQFGQLPFHCLITNMQIKLQLTSHIISSATQGYLMVH